MEVTKPAGVFCPQEAERPVLGFCGGSGITPVMSITKHVLATTLARYGSSTPTATATR